jgi:hypothetical protein
MAKRPEKPGSRIEIISASLEQAPILANLLELYAHDFSEFHGIALGEDGRFGYRSLPLYWSEPGRHPFLVRIKGKLAGFALVKKGSEISGKERECLGHGRILRASGISQEWFWNAHRS